MVIRENIEINGRQFIKNYSDEGFVIERDNVQYEEAIDPMPWAEDRFYTETDIKIPGWGDEKTEEPINSSQDITIDDTIESLMELGVKLYD